MGLGEPFCSTERCAPIFLLNKMVVPDITPVYKIVGQPYANPKTPLVEHGHPNQCSQNFTNIHLYRIEIHTWSKNHSVDVSRLKTGNCSKGHGQCFASTSKALLRLHELVAPRQRVGPTRAFHQRPTDLQHVPVFTKAGF